MPIQKATELYEWNDRERTTGAFRPTDSDDDGAWSYANIHLDGVSIELVGTTEENCDAAIAFFMELKTLIQTSRATD